MYLISLLTNSETLLWNRCPEKVASRKKVIYLLTHLKTVFVLFLTHHIIPFWLMINCNRSELSSYSIVFLWMWCALYLKPLSWFLSCFWVDVDSHLYFLLPLKFKALSWLWLFTGKIQTNDTLSPNYVLFVNASGL